MQVKFLNHENITKMYLFDNGAWILLDFGFGTALPVEVHISVEVAARARAEDWQLVHQ